MEPTIHQLTIPARDGFELSATIHEPAELENSAVIINPAVAVPRSFYQGYAAHLCSQGHVVVTYDYRGIGESRPTNLKGFNGRARDWAELDMSGVIEWTRARYRPEKLVLVGHSIGGQAAGLLENSDQVAAMVTVSAQSGFWGFQPGIEKFKALVSVSLVIPLLTRLAGYFPWSRLMPGQDLPKGAALEWSSWCRSPDYLFGDKTLDSLRNFPKFKAPILAYSFSDDVWGSQRSVENMMSRYTGADVTQRQRGPGDVGGSSIKHMGFFLPTSRSLWLEVDAWLEQQTGGH